MKARQQTKVVVTVDFFIPLYGTAYSVVAYSCHVADIDISRGYEPRGQTLHDHGYIFSIHERLKVT